MKPFLNTVKDYSNHVTYEEILKKYYGINIKTEITSHRKTTSIKIHLNKKFILKQIFLLFKHLYNSN